LGPNVEYTDTLLTCTGRHNPVHNNQPDKFAHTKEVGILDRSYNIQLQGHNQAMRFLHNSDRYKHNLLHICLTEPKKKECNNLCKLRTSQNTRLIPSLSHTTNTLKLVFTVASLLGVQH